MYPDGLCRVTDRFYSKTIQYQDINYLLAQNEDQEAIFELWCDFLNYFDSSMRLQFTFFDTAAGAEQFGRSIYIAPQEDYFNSVRTEYSDMLKNQLSNIGKSTRYYMDEFHLLVKEEQTAAYSVEIWKRFRKWGGIPTAITQNVKDLLASRAVENIFENSDFIYMLNQAAGDREILAKRLGISEHQLSHVKQSGKGEGLLFYGNVILPFIDRFPKDTELYRIMTTKPNEVSAG